MSWWRKGSGGGGGPRRGSTGSGPRRSARSAPSGPGRHALAAAGRDGGLHRIRRGLPGTAILRSRAVALLLPVNPRARGDRGPVRRRRGRRRIVSADAAGRGPRAGGSPAAARRQEWLEDGEPAEALDTAAAPLLAGNLSGDNTAAWSARPIGRPPPELVARRSIWPGRSGSCRRSWRPGRGPG